MWNVAEVDGAKGVGAFNVLSGAGRARAEAFAQAAKFLAVGGVPSWPQFGVAAELAVCQLFAGVGIEHVEGPFVEEGGWVAAASGGGGSEGRYKRG